MPPSVNPRFTDSVSLSVAFCLTLPFALSFLFSLPLSLSFSLARLCRKLQESQDSMTSRLEESEHKAQSIQTGTSLDIFSPIHPAMGFECEWGGGGHTSIPSIFGCVAALETNRSQLALANSPMNCTLNTLRPGQATQRHSRLSFNCFV